MLFQPPLPRRYASLTDEALGEASREVEVKLRATQPAVPARLRGLGGGRAEVLLDTPQAAIAPGQACVAYRGERVLGGGWIERPEVARAA